MRRAKDRQQGASGRLELEKCREDARKKNGPNAGPFTAVKKELEMREKDASGQGKLECVRRARPCAARLPSTRWGKVHTFKHPERRSKQPEDRQLEVVGNT